MSDPDAERKAKAARAKALVSQSLSNLCPSLPPPLGSTLQQINVKLDNADPLAGKET
jgi:hypothetical protein